MPSSGPQSIDRGTSCLTLAANRPIKLFPMGELLLSIAHAEAKMRQQQQAIPGRGGVSASIKLALQLNHSMKAGHA
jgi:hypothetical protein